MRLYLDCEFNGWGGQLISMALCSAGGRYFYEVLACPDPVEWVAENVMPVLAREAISQEEFTQKLQAFLCRFSTCDIFADWPDDIAYFCKSLIVGPGERMNTPPLGFRILSNLPKEAYENELRHNALSDAMAMMKAIELSELPQRDTTQNIC